MNGLLFFASLVFAFWVFVPPLINGAIDGVFDRRLSVPRQRFRRAVYELAFTGTRAGDEEGTERKRLHAEYMRERYGK